MVGAPFSQVCNSLTAADITQLEEELQEDDKEGQWWMAGQVTTANVVADLRQALQSSVSAVVQDSRSTERIVWGSQVDSS